MQLQVGEGKICISPSRRIDPFIFVQVDRWVSVQGTMIRGLPGGMLMLYSCRDEHSSFQFGDTATWIERFDQLMQDNTGIIIR